MKNMKAVNTAKARAEEILAQRAAELADLEGKIQNEITSAEAADKAAAVAADAGDTKAYQKAKDARRNAEDAREMYEMKRNKVQATALISEEERDKLINAILDEVQAEEDEAREKLATLSDQMHEIGATLSASAKAANEVLHTLQSDLYIGSKPERERTAKVQGTIFWSDAGITNHQYGVYTGKRTTPAPKVWNRV
ncbi:MAG: hypothetical protein LUE22_03070 [Oscillospiraceae bacterium]|nr:hypothetical protein [Oscillospiraceae bacterium]